MRAETSSRRKDSQISQILDLLPHRHDGDSKRSINGVEEGRLTKIKEDALGVLFEKNIRERERKKLGQFYTPQDVVDYVVDFLKISPDSKILDPACGCGVFLAAAYSRLRQINENAIQNVYGVDLNGSAAKIARTVLWLKSGRDFESLRCLEKNIRQGNSIVSKKNLDVQAFNWNENFAEVIDGGGFDFIIGNPPYITLKNKKDYDLCESVYSEIANGNTNAASLIVARSFELLKENGVMAFVLPKTLMRVNSYSKLRKFLLENSKILHVYDLGSRFKNVRGEQIILFIQKTRKKVKNDEVLVKVLESENGSLKNQKAFSVPQKMFRKHNAFLTFEEKEHYAIIEKIKGKPLEEISEIFRGLSISPDSKIISRSRNGSNKPIIKGKDISKFSCKTTRLIDSSWRNERIAKTKLMEKNKIILQNIFSSEAGIISCIDKKGRLNLDTVTNVILKNDSFKLECVFGILNSKLINFYLKYAIYNKSKLTMHTDKVYIGKLPILKPCKKTERGIIQLTEKLAKNENKKKILRLLDEKVYGLYGISEKEQQLIEEALKKTMSQKSFW